MTTPGSRPVVVAVDGTPGSAGALEYAVDEALRDGNRLHLVHVWPGSPPQDLVPVVACGELQAAGRAVLDESSASARRMAPGLEITTDLVVGPRSEGILRASRSGRLLVWAGQPVIASTSRSGAPRPLWLRVPRVRSWSCRRRGARSRPHVASWWA